MYKKFHSFVPPKGNDEDFSAIVSSIATLEDNNLSGNLKIGFTIINPDARDFLVRWCKYVPGVANHELAPLFAFLDKEGIKYNELTELVTYNPKHCHPAIKVTERRILRYPNENITAKGEF